MKNRSAGRLGRLFLNAVTLEHFAACNARGAQPFQNTTRFPLTTCGNDVARGYLRGFTLIELLVVVLVIGILSAIALPQYQKAVARARFATVKATARTLADVENLYYLDNGEFTFDVQNLAVQLPSGGTSIGTSQIQYPWGMCYVACEDASCGGCALYNSGDSNAWTINYFFHSFQTHRSACLVNDGAADYYTEICLAETGKTKAQGVHEHNYTIYFY
ncbi:prepilin-type N-terminal cleavage/methylation domain-containing protein [Candidatus Avelusimicrobium facis]|uniref:prepilin-type N-terminal cleavage/methylation domain-containing protein n=1 Tax=Candidatus Avelusimicrobium facis TaxID=3416203 RepID=UPI003D0A3598